MSILDNALQQSMKDQTKSKVVWENASPASEFGAQDLSLPAMQGFDAVEIQFGAGSSSVTGNVRLDIGANTPKAVFDNTTYPNRRHVAVYDSHILFGDAEQYSGNKWSIENDVVKPLVIYARKIIGGGRAIVNMLCSRILTGRRCAAWC